MNGPRLRPLGLGDIFDEGFDLYKRNFVFLLLVTSVAVVPLDILLAFAGPHVMGQVYTLFDVTANQSDASALWLLNIAVKLTIYLPLYALALGPLIIAASGCYLQQEPTLWITVRPVVRRLPGLAFCFLLAGLLLDLSLGFCLVGWLIAASLLLFVPQAFLLENLGPAKALRRSSALVNGYGGRIFTCLLMLGMMLWVIGLGIKLPLAYLFETAFGVGSQTNPFSGGGPMAYGQTQVVALLSAGLTHLVLFPFLACVLTALYYDMRVRKEGYDMDLLAAGLGYPALGVLRDYLPAVPVFQPVRPSMAPPPKAGRRGFRR